jgi:hypothetical protein
MIFCKRKSDKGLIVNDSSTVSSTRGPRSLLLSLLTQPIK